MLASLELAPPGLQPGNLLLGVGNPLFNLRRAPQRAPAVHIGFQAANGVVNGANLRRHGGRRDGGARSGEDLRRM